MSGIRIKLLAALAITQIAGCAVGSGEFSCPGVPSGMACTATRDVYDRTDGASAQMEKQAHATRKSSRDAADADTDANTDAGTGGDEAMPRRAGTAGTPVRQQKQLPIRKPAQVMRIWVAPWEDKDGNLHMSGLVYTEIVERRWSIGVPAAEDSGMTQPLRAPGTRNPGRSAPDTQSTGGGP